MTIPNLPYNPIPFDNDYFNNGIDALTFTTYKNKLDTEKTAELMREIVVSSNDQLANILGNSTIKRACCMGTSDTNYRKSGVSVMVRIPLTENIKNDINNGITDIEKKYGYFDKLITIPGSICDRPEFQNYTNKSTQCDKFYTSYCKNIINEYKNSPYYDESTYKYEDFMKYKPECGCFAPAPNDLAKVGLISEQDMQQCWVGTTCGKGKAGVWTPQNKQDCTPTIQSCTQGIFIDHTDATNINILNNKMSGTCNFSNTKTDANINPIPQSNQTNQEIMNTPPVQIGTKLTSSTPATTSTSTTTTQQTPATTSQQTPSTLATTTTTSQQTPPQQTSTQQTPATPSTTTTTSSNEKIYIYSGIAIFILILIIVIIYSIK